MHGLRTEDPDYRLLARGEKPNSNRNQFRLASFNIKSSREYNALLAAASTIKKNNFDIVGMQELEDKQKFDRVKVLLKSRGYDTYPKQATKTNPKARDYSNGLQSRAIAYDTKKFKFVKGSNIEVTRWKKAPRPQPGRYPILWLQHKSSGQKIIVINIHGSSGSVTGYKRNGVNGPAERYAQAKKYVAHIKKLSKEKLPIFMTGDFNEGYGPDTDREHQTDPGKIFHCMISKSGLMVNVYIAATKATTSTFCKRNPAWSGRIDQIYVTPSLKNSVTYRVLEGGGRTGTDHAIIPYTDVKLK